MNKWILGATMILGLATHAQACKPNEIQVQLVKVDLVGADTIDPLSKFHIISELQEKVTHECQLSDELRERVRDGFQQFGYFTAEVGNPEVTEISGLANQKRLAVSVRVNERKQYRLNHIEFAGAKAFPVAELRQLIKIKDGDILDIRDMREGLHNLRELYGSRGYMSFTPVPNTEIDDVNNLITITFDLEEGDQFRLGKLTLDGPEPYYGARQKLLEEWNSQVGQIYDLSMPAEAIELARNGGIGNGAVAVLAFLMARGESFPHVTLNEDTKTVDYNYEFKQQESTE